MFLLLLVVVHKMAPDPIRTEADGVKRTARLSFVLWMSAEIPQLFGPMCELALPAIFAEATLSERSTQFSLIA